MGRKLGTSQAIHSLLLALPICYRSTLLEQSLGIFFFNWKLITLQYCSGFCHTFTWISRGCTCVPHPGPPFHLPPHTIPQGHPSAPALSTLCHAWKLDWWFISYMIVLGLLSGHGRQCSFTSTRCKWEVLTLSLQQLDCDHQGNHH